MGGFAAAATQPMSDNIALVLGVVGGLAAIALLTLVIAALASVLSARTLTRGGKLLWALTVLHLPILGAVAWFVIGRQGPLNSLLGLVRSGRHEGLGSGEHVRDNLLEDRMERVFAGYQPNGREPRVDGRPRGSHPVTGGHAPTGYQHQQQVNGYHRETAVGAHARRVSPGVNGDSVPRFHDERIRIPRSRIPR
ncbi:PLDc_N domain-containing protein [Thermobifida halotolerans]|uniref:PLDc_N domain-containing protein n=1 Tax=Thermobifida halotolerans TaxID=483545 RepID=A0AA97LVY2_9ACTN|nr:PLD nuclease N-terminal domain-containing protein [Thermobifida halotolerans]UOE19069.1 PLDc_N domain-containing protein [Thermobifida halotolerans]